MTSPKLLNATVKCVLSGDTLILRGKQTANQPPPERQLNLAYIQAPRIGNQKKDDEPFAFESREFIRSRIVGKEVSFRVDYTIPNSGREYGTVYLGSENLAHLVVKEGWAKVREENRKNKEEDRDYDDLISFEQAAQSAVKGIWQDKEKYSRNVNYTFQEDSKAYLEKYKGQPIDGIVEQVRDGSSLRVLLMPPSAPQQYLNINISGIKAPIVRRDIPDQDNIVEPFGEEAKYFVESRLLQRNVRVILEGLSGNNQVFSASILHPAGNIAEALVSAGLAKVLDWSITVVTDGPAKLRAAENAAKQKRLKIWHDHVARSKAGGDDHEFEGTVIRIVNGDTLCVRVNRTGVEKKLQLSSIRQPKYVQLSAFSSLEQNLKELVSKTNRPKDPKIPEYNHDAKEFLRKKLIGKTVRVTIDYQKPASDGYEAKECATIKLGEFNPAEALLERGLAQIIRHRRDDEDRSSCYDQLLIAEQKAQTNAKGVHSNKEPPTYRIGDASENASKARQYLHSLQRVGRINGVVDFVNNATRFKIYLPKEGYKISFVLGGIRAPRTGRTPSEKSEPYATEAFEFANRKVLQRDVEIEVENVDKTGGFIGTLWLNKTDNFAELLLQEGLAKVHSFGPDANKFRKAETEAREARKNIWSLQEPLEEVDVTSLEEGEPRKEYIDVEISGIVSGGHFYVQVVNDDITSLEKMMSEFRLYHKNTQTSNASSLKTDQIVGAQFTADNQWYRAKIKKLSSDKKSAEVVYIDYGNSETIPLSRIRSIPDNFKKLPAQSQEAVLSFIKVHERDTDYGEEAYEKFQNIVANKQLVANIDYRERNLLHLTLYNPAQAQSSEVSINAELVRAGLALVNKKLPYYKRYPNLTKKLEESQEEAKKERMGMFEYGDATQDDDDDAGY
ncbi:5228_t:CDS:10 [Acaulospora colombiana]|uniref:5228_t:CDS:1 n=1 Tax=Acaulospora colombiana TaxID=27376 RepID=A0ACA9K4N7_9GLOM|nr:5228_t:CDS:10 [Acaulospora colombiana]